MKFYITAFLCCVFSFFLQAQEAKPTKKQTIDFIKRYFEEKYSFNCDADNSYYTVDNYKVDFNEETNILRIEYDESNFYKGEVSWKYKYRTETDMSKIESVKRWASTNNSGGCIKYSGLLKFEVASGEDYKMKQESIDIETGKSEIKMKSISELTVFMGCDSCEDKEKKEKLRKAFDHLRKLCGAPDPVNF